MIHAAVCTWPHVVASAYSSVRTSGGRRRRHTLGLYRSRTLTGFPAFQRPGTLVCALCRGGAIMKLGNIGGVRGPRGWRASGFLASPCCMSSLRGATGALVTGVDDLGAARGCPSGRWRWQPLAPGGPRQAMAPWRHRLTRHSAAATSAVPRLRRNRDCFSSTGTKPARKETFLRTSPCVQEGTGSCESPVESVGSGRAVLGTAPALLTRYAGSLRAWLMVAVAKVFCTNLRTLTSPSSAWSRCCLDCCCWQGVRSPGLRRNHRPDLCMTR